MYTHMHLPEVGKKKPKGKLQAQGVGTELMGVPGSGKGTQPLGLFPEWLRPDFSSQYRTQSPRCMVSTGRGRAHLTPTPGCPQDQITCEGVSRNGLVPRGTPKGISVDFHHTSAANEFSEARFAGRQRALPTAVEFTLQPGASPASARPGKQQPLLREVKFLCTEPGVADGLLKPVSNTHDGKQDFTLLPDTVA